MTMLLGELTFWVGAGFLIAGSLAFLAASERLREATDLLEGAKDHHRLAARINTHLALREAQHG